MSTYPGPFLVIYIAEDHSVPHLFASEAAVLDAVRRSNCEIYEANRAVEGLLALTPGQGVCFYSWVSVVRLAPTEHTGAASSMLDGVFALQNDNTVPWDTQRGDPIPDSCLPVCI